MPLIVLDIPVIRLHRVGEAIWGGQKGSIDQARKRGSRDPQHRRAGALALARASIDGPRPGAKPHGVQFGCNQPGRTGLNRGHSPTAATAGSGGEGRFSLIPKLVVRVRFPSLAQCRPGGRAPPTPRGSATGSTSFWCVVGELVPGGVGDVDVADALVEGVAGGVVGFREQEDVRRTCGQRGPAHLDRHGRPRLPWPRRWAGLETGSGPDHAGDHRRGARYGDGSAVRGLLRR